MEYSLQRTWKVPEAGWEYAGAQAEWKKLGCIGGSHCVEQCTLDRQIYNSLLELSDFQIRATASMSEWSVKNLRSPL